MSQLPDPQDDLLAYNREAWNEQVRRGNRWTVPVTADEIRRARQGDWQIILTPERPVPRDWFPDFGVRPVNVLCLAGSGGQQAPILAAAGAQVTVFDNSPAQLQQDADVAQREGLEIATIQGDMANLQGLDDEQFDLIVHPCSNTFVPNVHPVWSECFRVLRPGGALLAGFVNPVMFIFDDDLMDDGKFKVVHKIPYSDLTSISRQRREQYIAEGEPLCFGHSLEDLVGGQLRAGFEITGFLEDTWSEWKLSEYIPTFVMTRAIRPL